GGGLAFGQLQLRLHPAASRVERLAREHPAVYVVFDLLADERGTRVLDRPFADRRARLEAFARQNSLERIRPRKSSRSSVPAPDLRHAQAVTLTPAPGDVRQAKAWLARVGGGIDGIVAKRLDETYRSGEREGM